MMPSEEWKNQLGQAMLAYAQGNGSWDDVQKAFVDNWKTEYDERPRQPVSGEWKRGPSSTSSTRGPS